MKKIDPDKVNVEFRDRVMPLGPIHERKYTMTHSDETAELFVTIGTKYANDKMIDIRDEVLLAFEFSSAGLLLMGEVIVDGEGIPGNAERRNEIFAREMGTALQAIRYADADFYQANPALDHVPVYIWFRSDDPAYNKLYDYGTMSEYK